MKKTTVITMLFCITSLLISGCNKIEDRQSNAPTREEKTQKQMTNLDKKEEDYKKEDVKSTVTPKIDNFQKNNLNTNSVFPKTPSQRLLSMFESGSYIPPNAECSLSCLKELLFFEDENYATDGKNIYINVFDGGSSWSANYQIMNNIDVDSFQILNDLIGYTHYFKDKNNVYFNMFSTYDNLDTNIKVLKNIDSETVRVISTHCIADKNAVYCDVPNMYSNKEIEMKKVEGADPISFKIEKKANYETIFYDKNNRFENVSEKGIDIQIVK